LRATCSVTLKEVDAVAMMDADDDPFEIDARDAGLTRRHVR
jgi:hypothetical protein